MAVFKREKLIDISKRSEGGALVKRLESEIKELDREVSVLESELGQQVRENEHLKKELIDSDNHPSRKQDHAKELAESNRQVERLSSLIDQYELQIKYLQEEETNRFAADSLRLESQSDQGQVADLLLEENRQLKHEIDLILTQTVDEQEKLITKLQTELENISASHVSDEGQLIDVLNQQIDLQEKELLQAQEMLEDRNQKLREAEQEVKTLAQANQTLEMASQEAETKNGDALQVLVTELQDELNQLAQQLAVKESELDDAESNIAALNVQLAELEAQLAQVLTDSDQVAGTTQKLQEALEINEQTIADLRETSNSQLQERDALILALAEKDTAISTLTTQVSALEVMQNELTEQNDTISVQLTSTSKKLDEEQEKTADLQAVEAQLAVALHDLGKTKEASQELQELLDSKLQELADLSNKLTCVTESYTDQHVALQSQLAGLKQEMAVLIADEAGKNQVLETIKARLAQKEQECSDKEMAMLTLESTLKNQISELEAVQNDLSDQNTALSMELTSVIQKGYEEQSKTTQLQAELSELRLQQHAEVTDWEQVLSGKESELIAEKNDVSALTQELLAVKSSYQTLQDKNLSEQTKIQEEMAAADRKIVSLRQEVSDIREAKGHQVSLLQSIISDNKSLVLQLDQKIDQVKLENQRLSEEKHQKTQQLQAVIQEQYVKLAEAKNQNNRLESELLEKEEANQQELSEMMLMISRLKHEVLEEANLEISRKREEMKQEEQAFKTQLKREASDLLTEIEGFKDKFIGKIELD